MYKKKKMLLHHIKMQDPIYELQDRINRNLGAIASKLLQN